MTLGNVAVLDGSLVEGADRPRASARTRARPSVTDGDGLRAAKAARIDARRGSVVVRWARVAYLDAADSWIVSDSTPSIKAVWRTDYAAVAPAGWLPFVVWCKAYRVPAVLVAALLDSIKWMLVHPVRGPLFLTATGGVLAAWTL